MPLTLLPEKIAKKSISRKEVVLPMDEALAAIGIFESKGIRVLGWEGWVQTAEGQVGHGNAPQGTSNLSSFNVEAAAEICKRTITTDALLWRQQNPEATESLYFCITTE
jgi:hypothetical protein